MTKYEEALERFNLILGVQHGDIDVSKLSSAQRARFISFCIELGLDITDTTRPKNENLQKNEPKLHPLNYNPPYQNIVGIDVQYIKELFPEPIMDLKSNKEVLSIFSTKEIAYAETKVDPYATLTGIFSAKESIIKTGIVDNLKSDLSKIELEFNEFGKPVFTGIALSISHSKDYAVAVAVVGTANSKFAEGQSIYEETLPLNSDSNFEEKESLSIWIKLKEYSLVILISALTSLCVMKIETIQAFFR